MESLDLITQFLGTPRALWTLKRGSRTAAAIARWRHNGAVIDLSGADAYQVVFNLSGGQIIDFPRHAGSRKKIRAGCVGINSPESAGVIRVHGQADTLQIFMGDELIRGNRCNFMAPGFFAGAVEPELQSAAVQALVALEGGTCAGGNELESIVLKTAKILVSDSLVHQTLQGGLSPGARRRVSAVFDEGFIDPAKPAPRVTDLANTAGLSLFHFIRAHRRTEGQTPHARLIAARINRALELLLQTDASIEWISDVAQFASSSHFVSTFRTRMGVPPGAFRLAVRHRT